MLPTDESDAYEIIDDTELDRASGTGWAGGAGEEAFENSIGVLARDDDEDGAEDGPGEGVGVKRIGDTGLPARVIEEGLLLPLAREPKD